MRYRDMASIAFAATITVWLGLYGKAAVENMFYDSHAVNRDDARSVLATLISRDQWVDFHILSDATDVRLLTNAALHSVDAPDYDLTNPRQGWRYTLEYELLDAQRTVVEASEYHFRTQVRQLMDEQTGEPIYPIFLGKSGLVSAQTRPMHLAIDGFPSRPVILRARLKSADAGIQELVGRSLSRIERPDYGKRYTWNRLSKQRRELICKYTVYQPELLTFAERANLLKWRWAQTPAISESPRRHLYFIGSFDDQEIREEQLPEGLFTDANWLATVPVPEGQGNVRLEFTAVDPVPDTTSEIDVSWFGDSLTDRLVHKHALIDQTTQLTLSVDGGLIELDSIDRVVTRIYWTPTDLSSGQLGEEIEITPVPVLVEVFVVDDQPVEYSIGHLAEDATPLRLSVRYPYGPQFNDLTLRSSDDPNAQTVGTATAVWEYLDSDGNILDSGSLAFDPVVSRYDCLETPIGLEWLSESQQYYFSVPSRVQRLRVRSNACRLLVNASVRPACMSRTVRVPEDYQPYQRRTSLNRAWFGLNPPSEDDLVQANRSYIARLNIRPPQSDVDLVAGNYQWRNFRPRGQWIGRQILVPQACEDKIREQAVAAIYFELKPATDYDFAAFNSSTADMPGKLIVIADDAPGDISLNVNGQQVLSQNIRSARGEVDLADVAIADSGTLSVSSVGPARYFFAGRHVQKADRFLKRTAQRLGKNSLSFEFEKKTHDDELLTIQVYRGRSDNDRCKLRVAIDPPQDSIGSSPDPQVSWTALDRTFDLRPHRDQGSLLIGHNTPVDVGHRCFVRLGNDLGPGSYRIRLERIDDGPDGYVLMYETLPGQSWQRSIRVNATQKANHGS